MNADEAKACHAALSDKTGEPDARPWGEQFVELTRVLRKGTPLEQAQRLQKLYRCKAPLPETHEMMISRFEEPLFAAMGKAMKKKPGNLRAELHRGQPAFGREAPFRELGPLPALPPALAPEWEAGDGFWVFGEALSLGEWPASTEAPEAHPDGSKAALVRRALNGAWLVVRRGSEVTEDGESYEATKWVAVHSDHAARLDALVAEARPLGSTWVHGGNSAVVDVEVAEDRGYRRDFEAGEAKARGLIVPLGGDGTCEWSGTHAGEQLCLVRTFGVD